MNFLKRHGFPFALVLLFSGLLTGCSLDLFSSSDRNSSVADRKNYRQARPECRGLDLGTSRFTAQNFRTLVRCLNSNDSIPEFQSLVDEATDEQLAPVLELFNVGFLGDPDTIRGSYLFLRELEQAGELDALIQNLGGFLADPTRLRALLQFIDPGQTSRALDLRTEDRLAIESFISSLTATDAQEALRWVRNFLDSNAGRAFVARIKSVELTEKEKREWIKAVQSVLKNADRPNGLTAFLKDFIEPKRWLSFWRRLLPEADSGRLQVASEGEALLRTLFEGDRRNFKSLSALDNVMRLPVECFSGGHVFKDPWAQAIEVLKSNKKELPSFLLRFTPMTALHVRSFCEVPRGFLDHYPAVPRILESDGGGLFHDLLAASLESGNTLELSDLLFRRDSEWTAVLELAQRQGLLADAYFLATLPGPKSIGWLRSALRARMSDGSYRQYVDWLSRLSEDQSLAHLDLFSDFFRADLEPYFAGLQAMDTVFSRKLKNQETHLWFDGLKRLTLKSLRGELSARGVGGLSTLPSFDRAVRMLHTMTQDGRAGSLLLGVFQVLGGRGGHEGTASESGLSRLPMDFDRAHELSRKDLKRTQKRVLPLDPYRACAKIDLLKPIESQWKTVQACEGSSGELSRWREAFARLATTPAFPGKPGSMLALLEKEVRFPKAPRRESAAFVKLLRSGLQNGAFAEGIQSLDFLLNGDTGTPGLLNPALAWFKSVETARPGLLDRTLRVIGKSLKEPEAAGFFSWLGLAYEEVTPPARREVRVSLDETRAARWIRNKECRMDAASQKKRVSEIIDDYRHSIAGWESAGVPGRSRRRWTEAELLPRLDRVLKRAENPRVQSAFRSFLSSLSLRPGAVRTAQQRWTSAEAVRFFELRAKNHELLPYLYPGEEEVQVRLMSSLDRLESILTAANFSFPYVDGIAIKSGENFALKFMGMIAEAWGDSPRALWPDAIQKKFPHPSSAPTLRKVYLEMKSLLDRCAGGLPRTKRCDAVADPSDPADVQRYETWEPDPWIEAPDWIFSAQLKANLYNMMRALPVIEENLPDAKGPEAGGMLFLRDLFFEFYAATDARARSPREIKENQLSLFLDLGEIGMLRAFSYYFSRIQDPVERSAHSALVGAAGEILGAPGGEHILRNLFSRFSSDTRDWARAFARSAISSPDGALATTQVLLYAGAESARMGLTSALSEVLPVALQNGLGSLRHGRFQMKGSPSLAQAWRAIYSDSREGFHRQSAAHLKNLLQASQRTGLVADWSQVLMHSPESQAKLIAVLETWESMGTASEFRRLKLDQLTPRGVSLISGRENPEAATFIRRQVGEKLEGDLPRALLAWGIRDPNGFQHGVSGVFDALQSSRFDEFSELLERQLR